MTISKNYGTALTKFPTPKSFAVFCGRFFFFPLARTPEMQYNGYYAKFRDMGSVLRSCGTASDSVRMRGAPEQAYLPGFAQL